jgi:F0F1-type ATP synthase assembly protein I
LVGSTALPGIVLLIAGLVAGSFIVRSRRRA